MFALLVLVLGTLATTASGLWWAMRTDNGRAWLHATLEDLVNDSGSGLTLSLGALEGDLPVSLTIRDVSLTDTQGPWLTADRLTLAWDPWALLGGHLHITTLSSQALWVDRAPALPPSEEPDDPTAGGFDPALLGLLRLDRLALEGTYLGAALAGGDPVLLDAEGRLGPDDNGDGVSAHLDLRRIDGRPAEVHLTAGLTGADLDHLDLSLTTMEGTGGPLTTLIGLPGAAAWSLTLTGQGPLSDWSGDLSITADDLASLSASLAADLSNPAAPSLSLVARADPEPRAPASWRAVLTDRLDLTLAAAVAADGGLTLKDLRLATQALTLSGTASLGGENDSPLSAQLEGSLHRPDLLAPLVALPLGSAALTVTGEGTRSAPRLTATIDARDVAAAPDGPGVAHVTLTASAEPDGPLSDPATAVTLALNGRAEGPSGPAALTDLMASPVILAARGSLRPNDLSITLDSLRLADEDGLSLEATGDATLSPTPTGQASARLRLDDLRRLAPLLDGSDPAGALELRIDDVAMVETGRVSGALSLALTDAHLGLGPADAVLGPAPTLSGDISFAPDAGLTVDDLALDAAGLTLSGHAALPANFATVSAHLDATLADLALVAGDAASGAVILAADVSGLVADPSAALSAHIPEATMSGMAWTNIALQAEADSLASGALGTLSLTGTGPGGPVSVALSPHLPRYARIEVPDLTATVPGVTLTGSLSTALNTLLTEGTLSLRLDDPSRLTGWGAPPLQGSLAADLALAGSEERGQTATLTATSPGLTLPDAEVALGALTARATLADALGTPALDATLTASDGEAGALTWERLTVAASGPLTRLGITADLRGTGPTGPVTLASRAAIAPPGLAEQSLVTLTALDLETGGHRLRLTAPATVTLDEGPRVDRLALAVDDGTLAIVGGLRGAQALDVVIDGRALPLALADLAGPDAPGLSGRLDLTASAKGTLATLTGSFDLEARDVTMNDAPDVPPLTASATGALKRGRLTAKAAVSGFSEQPARASVDLPLRPGGTEILPANEPLSARATWAGPIGTVWEMLPLVGHRLSGDLTLDAAVDGTLAAPRVDADVTLRDGRYEHLTAGTLLEDLTVSATAAGSEHIQVSLSGTDGGSGRLSGDGDVRLTADGPMGAVSVHLDGTQLVRRDDVTARARADLRLDLEGTRASVSGTIESEDVRVRLDRIRGGGGSGTDWGKVVILDDPDEDPLAALERMATETQDPAKGTATETTQAADEDAAALPVALDITIRLPNKVYVSGQGLNSEWAGTLQVGGTAAVPRVSGVIQIRRGTLDAVGKTLSIETGTLEFTGGTPIDPLIDLIALYETEDLKARVGLNGPASDPKVILDSDPSLPNDEILSRILFDKTSGELTTLETVQLASALARLSGVTGGGGTDLTGMLRQAAGLDVLKVGGGLEADSASVEAGTYLSDDVYVGVEQGVEAGSGSVSVDVDLGSGFALESRAARSGEAEVGVQWQLDY